MLRVAMGVQTNPGPSHKCEPQKRKHMFTGSLDQDGFLLLKGGSERRSLNDGPDNKVEPKVL